MMRQFGGGKRNFGAGRGTDAAAITFRSALCHALGTGAGHCRGGGSGTGGCWLWVLGDGQEPSWGHGHGPHAPLEAVLRMLTLACRGVSALEAQASRALAEEPPEGWGAAGRPSAPLGVEGGQGHLAAPVDQMRFLEPSSFSPRCGHRRVISPSRSHLVFHLPLSLPDSLLLQGVLCLQLCFYTRMCFPNNPFLYPPQSPFYPQSPSLGSRCL